MPVTPDRPTTAARRARAAPPRRRSHGRSQRAAAFYAEALSPEDRAALDEAAAVEGVAQELAVLRLLLRRWLRDHPDDFVVAVRATELLARATNAARRQTAAEDDATLLDRLTADLHGILGLLAEAGEEAS